MSTLTISSILIDYIYLFCYTSSFTSCAGMAKKRKKREAIAFEEAVEAGMVKRKGSGKRKRMQKLAEIDRGLMEDGGAFKSGVLKLNRKMLLRKRK